MTDSIAVRTRLETRLAELEQRQARLMADLDEPHDPDSSEQAVQKEDDDALETQSFLVAGEISSVRRALMRIEKGTYGACALCGGAIAPARLAVRPEASLCIDCARQEQ